ncbi:MAG: hypothetical protein WBA57_08725 [Elainellaceae cyanobacterium]
MGWFTRKNETGPESKHGEYENPSTNLSSESEFNAARNAMTNGLYHLKEAPNHGDGSAKTPKTRQYHERHAKQGFDTAKKCFDANREQVLEEGKDRDNNDRRLPGSPW